MTAHRTHASEFDVIVAGIGPAGITAAQEAGKSGSVLLVDAAALPRDKSCGGMLNEYAQRFLDDISPIPSEMVLDPAHVNFRYWDWDRGIKKATELRFLNVNRAHYDDWMASLLPDSVEVAGATAVTGFRQDNNGVTVTLRNGADSTEVRCATLIGADGARSTVRRALGVESVGTYVTLQDFVALDGELEPYFNCIFMRGIGDCYAYSYIVPKGDTAIVGCVYYPKTQRPYERQNQVMHILRSKLPQLGDTIKREAGVALYVRAKNDVVPGKGRVLLAGEAGGFMSPTSGEGISYALNSGRLAGQAVVSSPAEERLATYVRSTEHIAENIRRKLKWLPFMESRAGKYLAGFVPTPIVSRITTGL